MIFVLPNQQYDVLEMFSENKHRVPHSTWAHMHRRASPVYVIGCEHQRQTTVPHGNSNPKAVEATPKQSSAAIFHNHNVVYNQTRPHHHLLSMQGVDDHQRHRRRIIAVACCVVAVVVVIPRCLFAGPWRKSTATTRRLGVRV